MKSIPQGSIKGVVFIHSYSWIPLNIPAQASALVVESIRAREYL